MPQRGTCVAKMDASRRARLAVGGFIDGEEKGTTKIWPSWPDVYRDQTSVL